MYLLRVSALDWKTGCYIGPFTRNPPVLIPAFGSVVDTSGRGIYAVKGDSNCPEFDIVREKSRGAVYTHFYWQVMSAYKSDSALDIDNPAVSVRLSRAWVWFTGGEAEARLMLNLLQRGLVE